MTCYSVYIQHMCAHVTLYNWCVIITHKVNALYFLLNYRIGQMEAEEKVLPDCNTRKIP